jgi:hypothetical protein
MFPQELRGSSRKSVLATYLCARGERLPISGFPAPLTVEGQMDFGLLGALLATYKGKIHPEDHGGQHEAQHQDFATFLQVLQRQDLNHTLAIPPSFDDVYQPMPEFALRSTASVLHHAIVGRTPASVRQ